LIKNKQFVQLSDSVLETLMSNDITEILQSFNDVIRFSKLLQDVRKN